jgi:hypothetical protein
MEVTALRADIEAFPLIQRIDHQAADRIGGGNLADVFLQL